MGPVGEAGPEAIIPLTRPRRARELAETSRLLDLLDLLDLLSAGRRRRRRSPGRRPLGASSTALP
ncbi:hypothetical protein QA995_09415 [Streptomyces scabiei]|uniref:hypothetical protein n=1 Tax=Streptomyces scabiei TaxID=1930 RepID=UPI0018FEB585|nr:hypothetical protein [Streptomyces scabiei]